MADRALSREAVLAGLQDIRLPADAAGGLAAELLAGVGIGLVLALLVGFVLRRVTRARRARPAPSARPLSDAERRRALLRRLRDTRPEAFARLAADLYKPGGLPELATLEAELARDA